MSANKTADPPVPAELVEAIAAFPTHRDVRHCGTTFAVPALDLYATCPVCAARVKVRAFAAGPEVEDVFDAVLAWMLRPGAAEAARRRQAEIAADPD